MFQFVGLGALFGRG